MRSTALLLASALVLTGCTTGPAQSTPADHPANPDAAPMPLTAPTAQPGAVGTPATQAAAAAYTCPMHNDVVTDRPGRCPKCGMTLVRKDGL